MTIEYDRTPEPWLTVGAPVKVITTARYGGHHDIAEDKVTRLTKRDIVLESGARFRHDSLQKRFHGSEERVYSRNRDYAYASRTCYLVAADSEWAASVAADVEIEIRRAKDAAAESAYKVSRAVDPERARAAITALQAYLEIAEKHGRG